MTINYVLRVGANLGENEICHMLISEISESWAHGSRNDTDQVGGIMCNLQYTLSFFLVSDVEYVAQYQGCSGKI